MTTSPKKRCLLAGLGSMLALSGCSTLTFSDEAVSPAPESVATSKAAVASSEGVAGVKKTVSVANVTLPQGLTWTEVPTSGTATATANTWSVNNTQYDPSATASPAATIPAVLCKVQLIVQKNAEFSIDTQKLLLEATSGSQLTTRPDPNLPAGVTGFVGEYHGPPPGSTAAPTTAWMRHWLTPGRTMISLWATSADLMDPGCDPAAIVATLGWDGTEP